VATGSSAVTRGAKLIYWGRASPAADFGVDDQARATEGERHLGSPVRFSSF
jgi:hypothetical protein